MLTKEQMTEFFNRLEGCIWNCDGGRDRSKSMMILESMGLDDVEIVEFLTLCQDHGGHCDCEVVINAKECLMVSGGRYEI